jgi:hypothetical protein
MTELDRWVFAGALSEVEPLVDVDRLLALGASASSRAPHPVAAPVPRRWSAADSAVVEQAKGVLMLRYGVGSYESLATLVRWAHDVDVPVPQIARTLVQGVCQGRPLVDDNARWLVRWLEQRLREDIADHAEANR